MSSRDSGGLWAPTLDRTYFASSRCRHWSSVGVHVDWEGTTRYMAMTVQRSYFCKPISPWSLNAGPFCAHQPDHSTLKHLYVR